MALKDSLVDMTLLEIKELKSIEDFVAVFNDRGGDKKLTKKTLKTYIIDSLIPNLSERELYEDCAYLLKRLEELK